MKNQLRVAMIAGTLGLGGAEKQLTYIAKGLKASGVEVFVFSLASGETYQCELENAGIAVDWVGKHKSPILRIAIILHKLVEKKVHLIYATHFYTNFYAAVCGKLLGILSIGSVRSDVQHEFGNNPNTAHWLINNTDSLIANSYLARRNALYHHVTPSRLYVLQNGIDLDEFDHQARQESWQSPFHGKVHVAMVGRLIKAKRVDRFLDWLAAVREESKEVVGVVVGEGPLRGELEKQALGLGLVPDGVLFTGLQENAPGLIKKCDILALTSDHEGFPNVVLEAMAAGLPVITLPAGDSDRVVVNTVNGYVVGADDKDLWVMRILTLVNSPHLRQQMGAAGRRMAVELYNSKNIAGYVLEIFGEIFERKKAHHLLELIPQLPTCSPIKGHGSIDGAY